MNRFATFLAVLGAACTVAAAARADDVAQGEKVFKRYCFACHSTEKGKNKVGPSLHGVVGRPSGSIANYSYSPAMKSAGLTWTPETLNKYLANPRAVVPGNKMAFIGVKNDAERQALIAYLATQKD